MAHKHKDKRDKSLTIVITIYNDLIDKVRREPTPVRSIKREMTRLENAWATTVDNDTV